jgi:septum formation protein
MRLLLASGSPRRRQILEDLGLEFEVRPSGVEESRHPDESPSVFAERVARDKALAIAEAGTVVVAADTIVVHRGVILGKPGHPTEARSMLQRLSGDRHTVITGVAVVRVDDSTSTWSDSERTAVTFLDLTDVEIAAYIASGEPMDKAGAYGMQGGGGALVASIEGNPSNVVGLPMPLTVRLLRAAGVPVFGQR